MSNQVLETAAKFSKKMLSEIEELQKNDNALLKKIDSELHEVVRLLIDNRADFRITDEEILDNLASVVEAQEVIKSLMDLKSIEQ